MDLQMQADSSSGQLQVKACACAKELDAEHKGRIPVMVSIKAPPSGTAAERPPVDLVLVLNVQKSRPAPVKWRMLLMEAVEAALGKLGDNDRLAVLADSRGRIAESAARKSEEELNKALHAKYGKEVKFMQVSDENCRQVQVSVVNKAIRSDTLVVTALELANSMLHNREYEDKENRAAYVIVISNSDEQDIGSLLAWRFLSTHAFGFRGAHNARTMCAIASSRECTYAVLDDERGRITQAFAACIHRITSAAAAMPVEVKLKCEGKVVLDAIDAPRISYFISYEKNAATIWTSADKAGVPTKVVVYLRPQGAHPADLPKFFTVRVKYGHITAHAPGSSDKVDRKVVPRSESDKQEGEVMADLDSKKMKESNKPDEKVVMESDKTDRKEVAESDKLDENNMVPESDKLDMTKVVMRSSKLDGKSDSKLILKVETMEHDGEVVLVRKGVQGYNEMAAEMVRIEAVKIVADITRENRSHLHLANLAEELHERWTKLQNSDCGKVAREAGLISMLALEMQEMQTRLHLNYFWLEYMLSWLSYQWWQLPLPPLFMDKRDTQVDDPPLQLEMFPKDRATPWANEYTVPRQLKVVVRVAAPGFKRYPVDLIAVLDASCGAEEETHKRLRLLVKAMELVMTKLDHKDRLAIMHVQSPATQPAARTSLMAMSEQGRNEISAMLKPLLVISKPPPAMANEKPPQTSRWREQLNKARKLLNIGSVNTSVRTQTSPGRQSSTAPVAQSVGGSSNLWKALEGAKEMLVDRPPLEKEQRAGFIIVISDSNDDSIIHETSRRSETDFVNYIVHTASFHDSGPRNTRAMNHIAHCSNGIYAVLDDGQDQISDAFTACINKINSIIAVSTRVTIRCNHSSTVVLNKIQSAGQVLHSLDPDRKFVSISAGTFYAGTVRNFITVLDNVGWYEYAMFYKFSTVDVTWRHPLSGKEDILTGEIYVRDGSELFKEAESRIILANTITIITNNLDENLVEDGEVVEKDKQVILERQSMDKLRRLIHECSREAQDAGEALLANEMEKWKDNLERERVKMHENQSVGKSMDRSFVDKMLAEPLAYLLSWLSRNF